MVPGIGGGEYIVIALVALLVVGPKDLPKLLRQLGRFVGKMRAMADDFRTSFDEMARQSELDDLRKEVEALRNQRSVPVLDDVKNEMNSLSSEIETHLQSTPQSTFTPEVDDRGVLLDTIEEAPVKKPRTRKTAVKKQSTIDVVALADTGETPVTAPKLKAIKGSAKPKAVKATAKPAPADKPARRKRSAS
jgi:sec-independent protein translocase protein TatB